MAREAYQVMGIKFAPLMIPLERRLQTLAVLYWIATFLFMAGITSVILTILAFTSYRWITILYITWLVYDWNTPYTGGRKNK
jgi:2-acylglycerol O-acyltransferase 2